MAGSPEYRALRTNTTVLVEELEVEVSKYAESFFEAELISGTAYNIAINTKLEQGERAREVVHNITARVKAQASLFPEVLKVLRALGLTKLADTVEGKYGQNGGTLSTAHPRNEAQNSTQTTASAAAGGGVSQLSSDPINPLLQELLTHTGTDSSKLKQSPDHGKLHGIASKQGQEWEICALSLGLTQNEIDDIKSNNVRNVKEQRYEALKLWKQRRSFKATYQVLMEVFIAEDRMDIAEYICELLK